MKKKSTTFPLQKHGIPLKSILHNNFPKNNSIVHEKNGKIFPNYLKIKYEKNYIFIDKKRKTFSQNKIKEKFFSSFLLFFAGIGMGVCEPENIWMCLGNPAN
jgi:hypothetical protein